MTRTQIAELLENGADCVTLEQAVAAYKEEQMRQQIIDQHPYAITRQYDGRWLTYVKVGKKRKPIRKRTKEEVEAALVEFYDRSKTVAGVYERYKNDLVTRGHNSTAVRYHYLWIKYFAESEFVKRKIAEVSASEITASLIGICRENRLTAKDFRDLKTITNGIWDFAVISDLVDVNRSREIRRISKEIFEQAMRKTDSEQIFSEAEQEAFVNTCFEMYEKHKNPGYYAVILNFLLGIRAGELCALKLSDFDFERHTLTIQREETKVWTFRDGKPKTAGTQIVSYLKANKPVRIITIGEQETEAFVLYIVKRIQETGRDCDEWLFTRPDGNRMTESNIMHCVQNARAKCGVGEKTNHNIRKSVITKLIQSRLFSTTDIMRQAGHNSFETTQKYYAFADRTDKSAAVGKALNFGITLVSNFEERETPENLEK